MHFTSVFVFVFICLFSTSKHDCVVKCDNIHTNTHNHANTHDQNVCMYVDITLQNIPY